MLARSCLRFALAFAFMGGPALALAQEVTLDTPNSSLTPEQFGRLMSTTNRIGGGVLVEPTYPGGSGYRSLLLPDIDYTYKNRFFVNLEDGAGAYLYNDGALSISTSGFVRLGRDQTNSPNILGLGNIAEAPQGRFAGEYDVGWIDVKGSFAHDFSGSYGNTFQAKLGTAVPLTNQIVVVPSLTTTLGDHNYMQTWYGVSEFQSLATGKPFFPAHAGVESVGTTVDALYRFAPNLALVGRGAVNYLVANVARSPVVERRVQTTLGLGISYLFR
ncbi:MAG: MipA/OmpV family protein [Hyphomicrobiales bacterium]|nr:MipA/OmpV family protein [Hyphomicrobiales bacterium]MBV9430593.1 MipA/OmpV family protein [Hyphomicrobiales bacterium]